MFLLFGPPGAGKGTQAELLMQKYNLKKFSMGDILREEVAAGSKIGKMVEGVLKKGTLVSDDIVFEIVEDFVLENSHKNILFDGFPRNLNQALGLERILAQHNLKLVLAIELYLPEEEIITRISGRNYCPVCGAIFNEATNPPVRSGICDKCGARLVKRPDDDPQVIKNRLLIYNEETRPLAEYYKAQGIYRQVSALGDKETVFKRLIQVIDGYFK
ncbi:MAG: adenylate kinase [candidate division WOR-3 bacterium]